MISMLDSDKEKKSSVGQSRYATERSPGGNGTVIRCRYEK